MQDNNAKCTHDDCFTCPYRDCISNREPVKRKKGRKRLPPEEKKRHRREQQRKYLDKHREQINERQREYYQKRKGRQQGAESIKK